MTHDQNPLDYAPPPPRRSHVRVLVLGAFGLLAVAGLLLVARLVVEMLDGR